LNSQSDDILFNVHSIVANTVHEGPFNRLAIWFQGCNIGCKDCANPEMLPLKPKHILSLNKIREIIQESKNKHSIEGVTLLGGEPTLQSHLYALCESIQRLGLGVILYTGKSINDLDTSLVSHTDLIIDGAYQKGNESKNRKNIGSDNQNLILISNRYRDAVHWFETNKTDGTFRVTKQAITYDGNQIINNLNSSSQ